MSAQPLADLNAERAVLGGCVLDPDAWAVASDVLQADDFYLDRHAELWRAMAALVAAQQPIDTVTLQGQLATSGRLERAGGWEYVLGLTDTIPTVANIEAHAEHVHQLATARAVRRALDELRAEFNRPIDDLPALLDRAETLLGKATAGRLSRVGVDIGDAVFEYVRELTEQAENRRPAGWRTGYPRLDKYLSGWVPGNVVILGARPGVGKTAFALDCAKHAARLNGVAVYVRSIEMQRRELIGRMLASEGLVDGTRLRNAQLSRDEWRRLQEAAAELEQLSIHIDDHASPTVLDIRRGARRYQQRCKALSKELGLIVIDYVQMIAAHVKGESREETVAAISRGLKALAKEIGVPILALASLNRGPETRNSKDKRPQLSDLRESGGIESDADTVMFLYRDELYNAESADAGIAEIIIAKQRSGPTGVIKVAYRREYTRFDSLAENRQEGG